MVAHMPYRDLSTPWYYVSRLISIITGMSAKTMMLKIQYSLNLPEGVVLLNTENKPTSKTHQFKIDDNTTTPSSGNNNNSQLGEAKNLKSYYDALRNALEEARSQVGDELTAWRDRVGKEELNKEPKQGNGDEELEEEGEEEEG